MYELYVGWERFWFERGIYEFEDELEFVSIKWIANCIQNYWQ